MDGVIMSLRRSINSSPNHEFIVNTKTSGNKKIILDRTFPAGTYSVSSTLGDTSYDIYLIATDGTSAGILNGTTATSTIVASKAFDKIVVYGIPNNDTLLFNYKNLYEPTADSTDDFAVAPLINSITVSSLPNQNNTTTISGKNFANDVTVTFTGTDNVVRNAKNIVRSSSTELIVTRPDSMPTDYSPYTITISNPGISAPTSTNVNKLSNSITVGSAPTWVTSTSLNNFIKTQPFSQTITATDADGGSSISYSIISNNLTTGLTFNESTGQISGTPTVNILSPYTITVRATDSGGNYVDRTFSIAQAIPDSPLVTNVIDVGTSRSYDNGAVDVYFSAPSYTGTSAVTSYTVTSSANHTASGSSSPIRVTGLFSDTSYTFTVTATNASGTSLSSSASSLVTATTVPQAPTIGTVSTPSAGVFSVSVPFTANATGGKTITSYSVLSSPSNISGTGSSSPVTVSNLAGGATYTFSVAAINANGTSAYSSSSNSIATSTLTLVDNFNRANGSLGTSSDGKSLWSVQRGNFNVTSNMAYSTDTNNSVATAFLPTSTITNAQIDMVSDQGGSGLSFWVTDANSWWSIYPHYTSVTNSTTSTSCTGPSLSGQYNDCTGPSASNACSKSAGSFLVTAYCGGDIYGQYGRASCSLSSTVQTNLNNSCPGNNYIECCYQNYTVNATNVTNTVTTTNYASSIRIANQSGVQHENTYANSFNPIRSLGMSTSGNTISYSGYSAVTKGGSVLVSSSYTPGSPTKGNRIGLFRGTSNYNAGGYLDNINVTVS